MKYVPSIVFFSVLTAMFSVVGYFDHTDFWFFDLQWDYAITSGMVMSALVYPLGKATAHWRHNLTRKVK